MPNPYGRQGAPMVQPRKDDLWEWLREAQSDAAEQRRLRKIAEAKLETAIRKLGEMTLDTVIKEEAENATIVMQSAEQRPSWRRF